MTTTKNAVGNSLTGVTGSGAFVGATSPTLVTPNLGVPSAIDLTNASNPPAPAESTVTFTDITTNNASTSKHGFLKKLTGSATDYMDGSGAWSTPAGGGGGGSALPPNICSVSLSGNQTLSHTSGGNLIAFDTVAVDTTSAFNTTSHKYTPNIAGWYKVTLTAQFDNNFTAGTNMQAVILFNDTSGSGGVQQQGIAKPVGNVLLTLTAIQYIYCNGSTDYIAAFADNNDSVDRNLFGGTTQTTMLIEQLATSGSSGPIIATAYANGSQTLGIGETVIGYDTIISDSHSYFDTTNHKFLPTNGSAKFYSVTAVFMVQGWPDQGTIGFRLYKNTSIEWDHVFVVSNSGSGFQSVIASGIVQLNGSSDYILVKCNNNSGSGHALGNYQSSTYFHIAAID